MNILHLSDFHLNTYNLEDWKNYVRSAMLSKLSELTESEKIDIIAFTGDIADKGGENFKSISEVFNIFEIEVVEPLIKALNIPKNHFIIIPGNHDVIRSLDHPIDELGSQKYFEDRKNLQTFMMNAKTNNDFQKFLRIKSYKEFEKTFYKSFESKFNWDVFGNSTILQIGKTSVGICALNSAWRCYNNDDKGKLIVGEQQLIGHFNHIKSAHIKIALLHHPFDTLAEVDKRVISDHLFTDFDIVLMGHTHETLTSLQTSVNGTLFLHVAPSASNDIRSDSRSFANGFTIIRYDKSVKLVKCTYFRYKHFNKTFVPNTDQGNSGTGIEEFPINEPAKKKTIDAIDRALTIISTERLPEINSQLIGNQLSEKVNTLKEAFVLPPIDDGQITSEELKDRILSLNQVIGANHNFCFFGGSESGRTTFLNRLIIEFIENFSVIRKIPVYVDFNSIGNKELITCVKEYLMCSTDQAKALLESKNLVLLIDNLNYGYNDENFHQVNRLYKFSIDYDQIQLICTSQSELNGLLPNEFITKNRIPFRNYFIRPLKSREIKELMKKWVPADNEDELKIDDRLDKLVSNFHNYSLPTSPMSIALFLWSTVYSDKPPINGAVLIEIYIEIILEKLSLVNIYRSTFDFTNKVQLLSKIAYEIYQHSEDNYSISVGELTHIVETYVKKEVGMPYDPTVIVQYFLQRKIFTQYGGNRIKFSKSCFFHFFLAKRMIYDNDFKNFVLDENRYWNFDKEIDFYTGLTRSDKVLFELIFNRFNKEFEGLQPILSNVDIDEYFTPYRQNSAPIAKEVEIGTITSSRPSEKMIDEFHDKRLDSIKDPDKLIQNEERISLAKILIIMSNVLRNSEGIEDLKLKSKAYNAIVKNAIIYSILLREAIIGYVLRNNSLPPTVPLEIDLINYLTNLPLFTQGGMSKFTGTNKLAPVVLLKINEDRKDIKISNIEQFMSIAFYSDIYGFEFDKQWVLFIRSLNADYKKNIACNYSFYVLLNYFYRRSRNGSTNEELYLDLLIELKIRTQNWPRRLKDSFVKSLQDARKKYLG